MFHFIANLKPYTFHRGRGNRRFDAYLLSADYFDENEKLAHEVTTENRILVADNGNVDLITGLMKQHKTAAKILDTARKEEERKLGIHYARPGQLSTQLQDRFRQFANDLALSSEAAIDDSHIRTTLAEQLAMSPSYLIGMEDFAIVCMTGLNIEPEYSCLPSSYYEERIERPLEFAIDTLNGKYGYCDSRVFAGLHAMDYDTAYLAGKKAAENGLNAIATGLVGALRDKNSVDFRVEKGALIEFPKSLPRPYLRTMEIATGIHQGYREHTGTNPEFHALGAGTPILLPLFSLLAEKGTYFATDSTSPIIDGWTASTTSLYVDQPAPLKLKAHRIAQFWLEDGRGWDCQCPYCRHFMQAYPPNLQKAKAWWKAEGSPKLSKSSLYSSSPLSNWLPILSNPEDPTLRREAALTRVAHNHWVVKKIESDIREHQSSKQAMRNWVENVMGAYMESGASSRWKASALEAWKIANAFSKGS
ncbi:MAG: hypothetical protein P8171_23820 [Candidatus Thiodiazotropha sp.]